MNDIKKAVNTPERLIDENELMEWLKGKIRECVLLNAHAEAATTEEIIRYVKHMPAVNAVPVEWLQEKMNIADDAGDLDSADLISWLIQTWQKEQKE